jgi:hypothetical protein
MFNRQTDRQTDGQTDDGQPEKLTWAFSSGELKNQFVTISKKVMNEWEQQMDRHRLVSIFLSLYSHVFKFPNLLLFVFHFAICNERTECVYNLRIISNGFLFFENCQGVYIQTE